MKVQPRAIFGLLVLLFFVFLVWEAREWRPQARLYPWVIGFPMVVLAVLHLAKELRGKIGQKKGSEQGTPVDFQFTKGIDPVTARRRTINIFCWIVGSVAGLWLVGFSITIPLLCFLYLKVHSGEGWPMTIVLTGVAWLVFWGLFDRFLRLPFPEGKIFLWMGW
ncbi:MAG: tripartite tricarboxylate transporter TctB family protein [Candidatus Binatia bacterium]